MLYIFTMSDNVFTIIVLAIALITFVSIVYIMAKNSKDESTGIMSWEDAINEQIKEQKLRARKDRAIKNKSYYYIRMYIAKETENMSPLDDMNYKEGNYFYTFDEAYDVMQNFIKQLKNK